MNKKLKKIIGITTSLVLSLCMLTGCSSSKSASSSTSSDASKNQSEKLPKEINVTYVKSPLNVPSILEKMIHYSIKNLNLIIYQLNGLK